VDEHRFARARFFRDDTGGWQRVEPWMSTFVNTDTGQVLGIVDGPQQHRHPGLLDARTPAWRDRIEVVAIDPSATSGPPSIPPFPRRGSASTTGTWCGSRT
jgi:hypothetical protein